MNKFLLPVLCLLGTATAFGASEKGSPFRFAPRHSTEWRTLEPSETPARKGRRQAATEPTLVLPPSSMTGYLDGPDGTSWFYTADLDTELTELEGGYAYTEHYKGLTATIYDSEYKVAGKIQCEFPMVEGAIRINDVEIANDITCKFFNFDSNPEVMVMINYNFEDYHTEQLSLVFSLRGEQPAEQVVEMPGYYINYIDTATDPWSENVYMLFIQDSSVGAGYQVDLYTKAGYSGPCSSIKTFDVNEMLIQGTGDEGFPMLMASEGGILYIAAAQYEKTYFLNPLDFEDDTLSPDNHYCVTLYKAVGRNVSEVSTTRIPIDYEPEDCSYTMPALGMFQGNGDLCFGQYTSPGEVAYVITNQNLSQNFDDLGYTLKAYDKDGNELKTIAKNIVGYIRMNDIPGLERQFGFLTVNDDEVGSQNITFTDLPSVTVRGTMPRGDSPETILTTDIDRVKAGSSYNYVGSYGYAQEDADGNTLHRIGWWNDRLQPLHTDLVNLGQGVQIAQVNISQPVLDRYLFDTDENLDYLFLLQRSDEDAESSHTEMVVVDTDGNVKARKVFTTESYGIGVGVVNLETSPALFCAWIGEDELAHIELTDLPFNCFSAGGDGTAENPRIVSTPGDFALIGRYPSDCFAVGNDLDFTGYDVKPIAQDFSGSLDGRGHALKGIVIDNNSVASALFTSLTSGSSVCNMTLVEPRFVFNSGIETGAYLAATALEANISNVHIISPKATASTEDDWTAFGSLVGRGTVYTIIQGCSVSDASIRLGGISNVGGIAGEGRTSLEIDACSFSGRIEGATAVGGILGNGDAGGRVADCHVNANIKALNTVGGIIGSSARKKVANCYVEGSLTATEADRWSRQLGAGGIVGTLATDYNEECTEPVVIGCVVGLAAINAEADGTVHRIVGLSCANEPGESLPEAWIKDNYAFASLPIVDTGIEAGATTTEGASVELSAADKAFYQSLGFNYGETVDAPWDGNNAAPRPSLWFEAASSRMIILDRESVDGHAGETVAVGIEFYGIDKDDLTAESSDDDVAIASIEYSDATLVIDLVGEGSAVVTVTDGIVSASLRVDVSTSGIVTVTPVDSTSISVVNGVVKADGIIDIYNTSGVKVASGIDRVDLGRLGHGVYVARCGSSAVKIAH